MARKKKYDEAEVIEKALALFWANGYETTSTRMLEKHMGINQFSIYASFGNKEGVLKECIKLYQHKIKVITNKLEASNKSVQGVKEYFYDFIDFSSKNDKAKGCLITNTIHEFGIKNDNNITADALTFTNHIRALFYKNLSLDTSKQDELLQKQADYLIVAMASIATSSKFFSKDLVGNYIENTFINI